MSFSRDRTALCFVRRVRAVVCAALVLGSGCTYRTSLDGGTHDAGEGGAEPGEFVATEADFAAYASWTQTLEPSVGPGALQSLIESAHMAANATVTRRAFGNARALERSAGAEYRVGAIFVKELRGSDGAVLAMAAMVKRGGGFNPMNRGWEWFMLRADGSIANRGAVLDPDCNSCHIRAMSGDYTFTR